MFLYNNQLWLEDIDTVSKELPELDSLSGKSILITGATGLIGSALVDILFRYNDTHETKIKIFAAGRNIEKMSDRFDSMVNRDDFVFVHYDAVKSENKIPQDIDYIIHGAGNANPGLYIKEPVETMLSNFLGLHELLHYSKTNGIKRVLYISSSEVYGRKNNNEQYKEDEYGYVDLLNPRNSYAMAKRAAETLCVSYAAEYGVDTVIVRPGHIYGPTASPDDNRVSSAWAYMAARGEDIVMKSDGSQTRSYVYCLDCASAILKVLVSGEKSKAYNISNPDSIISIRQLAEILTHNAGSHLHLEFPSETERNGFNPMNNSSLSSVELQLIGWHGCFNAEAGFSHTFSILKNALARIQY